MLEALNDILAGGGAGTDGGIGKALRELQGLKLKAVAGAAANTNIAVAGIATEDTIVGALEFTAGVPAEIPLTITSAGNVQSTTDTTGNVVVLLYFNKQ